MNINELFAILSKENNQFFLNTQEYKENINLYKESLKRIDQENEGLRDIQYYLMYHKAVPSFRDMNYTLSKITEIEENIKKLDPSYKSNLEGALKIFNRELRELQEIENAF
jgi:ABC-type Zn uptake system ZnuABC Zn-binding protein ZnuA